MNPGRSKYLRTSQLRTDATHKKYRSLLAKGGELVRIFAKPPALEMADAPMSPEEMSAASVAADFAVLFAK